jgi:hypothetical protein
VLFKGIVGGSLFRTKYVKGEYFGLMFGEKQTNTVIVNGFSQFEN